MKPSAVERPAPRQGSGVGGAKTLARLLQGTEGKIGEKAAAAGTPGGSGGERIGRRSFGRSCARVVEPAGAGAEWIDRE